MSEEYKSIEAKKRLNAMALQRLHVDEAIENLRAEFALFCEKLKKDGLPDFYEVEIRRKPMRAALFPPFEFRIDVSDNVFLVGSTLGEKSQRLETAIPWKRSHRQIFIRTAEARGKKVSPRALRENPQPGAKARWKNPSIRSAVSSMAKVLRETVLVWGGLKHAPKIADEAAIGLSYSKDGGLMISLPVKLASGEYAGSPDH